MKVIDLSHYIEPDMPVYPGTEGPIIEKANTIEVDGFAEHILRMYSHTGTHIDAPAHILRDGKGLDNLDIEHFVGRGVILDFSNEQVQFINSHDLIAYKNKLKQAEFVILKTGWSQYFGKETYFQGFPSLTIEAAKWLMQFNLKGIGIDTLSIDSMTSKDMMIHKICMSHNMIIIENLTNLDAIKKEYFTLSVLPLKTKNADGSPVRAVAIE